MRLFYAGPQIHHLCGGAGKTEENAKKIGPTMAPRGAAFYRVFKRQFIYKILELREKG